MRHTGTTVLDESLTMENRVKMIPFFPLDFFFLFIPVEDQDPSVTIEMEE